MFCMQCGKTLLPTDTSCKCCGALVGESRFEGHPYTAAQIRVRPGETVYRDNQHTRTTYLSETAQTTESEDVYARTTYRAVSPDKPIGADVEPVASVSPSASEKKSSAYTPRHARSHETGFGGTSHEDTSFSMNDLRAREIKIETKKGISDDVLAYVSSIGIGGADVEEPVRPRRTRRSVAERAQAVDVDAADAAETAAAESFDALDDEADEALYDDEATERIHPLKAFWQRLRRTDDEYDDDETDWVDDDGEDEDLGGVAPWRKSPANRRADASDRVFDLDDDEGVEEPPKGRRRSAGFEVYDEPEEYSEEDDRPPRFRLPRIPLVKYAVVLLLLGLAVTGVVMGLSTITQNSAQAPIDGVTLPLYHQAIEYLDTHATEAYKSERLGTYATSGLTAFYSAIQGDLTAITAMQPETPAENDQRFLNALKAVQQNINNALTNDVLSVTNTMLTDTEKTTQSNARWKTIADWIQAFKNATSVVQLDAIINGEPIEIVQNTTPAPKVTSTPVTYATLAKGSEGNAVKEMQTRLKALGYLSELPDGVFGTKTQTAVKLFQEAAGIIANGIADHPTLQRLYADDAPVKRH